MPVAKGNVPWNAGTSEGWTDKRGYRWVYVNENGRRRAKREHRVLMESALGRPLRPDELIHHINGDKTDNRLENLELVEWGAHTAKHHNGARHTEYTKKTQEVIARFREENAHLVRVNADLLAALKNLSIAADTAELLIRENWLGEAQSLRRHVTAAIATIAKATGGAEHERG